MKILRIVIPLVVLAIVVRVFIRHIPALKQRVMQQLANALDMDVDELQDEMSSGKSVREIAEERGVSMDDLRAAFTGSHGRKG